MAKHQPSAETTASVTCRCCGAVLRSTQPTPRIDHIRGNEHTKRALEVAITGGFRIAFTGSGSNYPDALAFAQIARSRGITAYCLAPCPCGNHGNAERACVCRPAHMRRMQATKQYQIGLQADLHVDVSSLHEARLGHTRRGETDETILERIERNRQYVLPVPSAHDAAAGRLMQAAVRQLDLSNAGIERVWRLAAVIAQMAGMPIIGAAHLAESLQYRSRHEVQRKAVA